MQLTELGRYRIVGVIGRGGMGVVYDAHDPQIDRDVAIKTISLDALSDHERAMFESRFRAEMRSTGRLQHHNIASLYDAGRDGGTAYIVMERVQGQDLKRRLQAGERFTPTQAVDITLQLLAALEYAHRRQVIHRDVKPANVMLQPDGTVKLCDFGVARLADSDATRTHGMIVGSLRYASPEQISGQPLDARTDIFSAGALLFELLTGRLPFQGNSDVEILHRIAHEVAPSLRSIDPTIPPAVDAAVQRALAKEPADRFASAADFARALGAPTLTGFDTLPPAPASPLIDDPDATRPVHSIDTRAWAPTAAPASSTGSFAMPPVAPAVPTPAGAATMTLSPTPTPTPAPGPLPPSPEAPKRRHGLVAAAAIGAVAAAAGVWYAVRPAPPVASVAQTPTPVLPARVEPAMQPSAPPVASQASVAPASASSPAQAVEATSLAASAALAAPATPAPAPAPAAPLKPPAVVAVRVPTGPWHGQLVCGAVIAPRNPGPESGPFKADVDLGVDGKRLMWTRNTKVVTEALSGTFDAQGRLSAEGKGARKDRPEQWRYRAQGQYVAAGNRIELRVQLLRGADGSLARECTLAAEPGAPTVVAAAAAPLAAPPKSPPASAATPTKPAPALLASLQGTWMGQMKCGALLNAGPNSTRTEPFEAKIRLDVTGQKIAWTRESATAIEAANGTIDGNGRFTAEGEGEVKDGSRRNPWQLNVQGEYITREKAIEGRAQIVRRRDGAVVRECTLHAVRS